MARRLTNQPSKAAARDDASAADKSECRQRQAGGSDGLARVALQHGQSARPPTSSVLPGGQRASGPPPSGTTLAPPRSMTCESPRDVRRTSSSLPSAITVSAAQAMAEASGSSRPER